MEDTNGLSLLPVRMSAKTRAWIKKRAAAERRSQSQMAAWLLEQAREQEELRRAG